MALVSVTEEEVYRGILKNTRAYANDHVLCFERKFTEDLGYIIKNGRKEVVRKFLECHRGSGGTLGLLEFRHEN